MDFMNFAQRLKALRLQKGLAQWEIAKLINVSQPTYWAYENDRSIPHTNTQIQLAKVLGVTVNELMKNEGGEEHENAREAERSSTIIDESETSSKNTQ